MVQYPVAECFHTESATISSYCESQSQTVYSVLSGKVNYSSPPINKTPLRGMVNKFDGTIVVRVFTSLPSPIVRRPPHWQEPVEVMTGYQPYSKFAAYTACQNWLL